MVRSTLALVLMTLMLACGQTSTAPSGQPFVPPPPSHPPAQIASPKGGVSTLPTFVGDSMVGDSIALPFGVSVDNLDPTMRVTIRFHPCIGAYTVVPCPGSYGWEPDYSIPPGTPSQDSAYIESGHISGGDSVTVMGADIDSTFTWVLGTTVGDQRMDYSVTVMIGDSLVSESNGVILLPVRSQ
jgi:hypothetical protein